MRIFFSILVLLINLQSLSKADSIKDFEIEGMSVGDSLLDFYGISEIQEAENNPTYYPKSKKFKVIFFLSKKKELFDYVNITLKDNDKKYIIYSIRGEKEINFDKCFKMKNEQIDGIENILSRINKDEYTSYYGANYGNTEAHVTEYTLDDGAHIRIFCAKYDQNNELVRNSGWVDGLEIGLSSKKFVNFLTNEAY